MYKNRNGINKKYRYKLIETKTNQISEIVFEPTPVSHNTNRSVNGKHFHFIPHDYKPFWFFNIIWNIINWYKRPVKKPNKIISATKTISKRFSKAIGIILLAVIGTILSAIIWLEYKEQILSIWRKLF